MTLAGLVGRCAYGNTNWNLDKLLYKTFLSVLNDFRVGRKNNGWPHMITIKETCDWLRKSFAWGKRVAALEERVTQLENMAKGDIPPDACKHCGKREARMVWSVPLDEGMTRQDWKCGSCGQIEIRSLKPR